MTESGASEILTTDLSRIEAVALDFDGTLLDPGELIRPEAIAAMQRAAAVGVRIATASGRSLAGQLRILESNGLGAAIGLPHALSCDERMNYLLDEGEYRPQATWNDRMAQVWRDLEPVAWQALADAEQALAEAGIACERSMDPAVVPERGLVGLRFESEAAAIAARTLVAEAVARRTNELMITQNWHLVHILARAGGKGRTLAALAEAWGLALHQLLAVGDRHNDVPMLDGTCGLTPAAVGNAVADIVELVSRQGGYVAEAAMGLGVAEILDAVAAARRS